MTLVTGATGFVGNHVARFLASRGERLRLLARRASDEARLAVLGQEVCLGDLRDEASITRAVSGCRAVYHIAAVYKLWSRDPRDIYASNVDGTRNLLEAAWQAGVERVLYTSSVGAIAASREGTPVTEESPSSLDQMTGHYKRSKYMAEQEALRYAAAGLPVVIVNPTAPVGEGDFKPTPTGKIVEDFLAGKVPAYLDTGLNLVDVRDVARGHWLASERGRMGERYLLGSENLSLRQILERLARIAGREAPRLRLPYSAAWAAGAACEAWSRLSGNPPAIPLDAVRMARYTMFADCSKARRVLGFDPEPVNSALERAVHWIRQNDRNAVSPRRC